MRSEASSPHLDFTLYMHIMRTYIYVLYAFKAVQGMLVHKFIFSHIHGYCLSHWLSAPHVLGSIPDR